MKLTLKLLTALFWGPFLILAAIVAIIRLLTNITIIFTWQKAVEWSDEMMIQVNEFFKWLKDKD